jgi:hypothetical protein
VAGWRSIAAGKYDAPLRARARSYLTLPKPVIVTFHHEPSNDGTEAEGADFAAAWCHIHDVFKAEGALSTVAFAPIAADFLFNPRNSRNPGHWVTADVLSRVNDHSFLGIDLYQTSNKPRIRPSARRRSLLGRCSRLSEHDGGRRRDRSHRLLRRFPGTRDLDEEQLDVV